ncbi:unnamed protein product [Adineta steineri]|uniref:Ricin B lectin domain-containing protein n=1 Tax=Adineta steineri TaxID=433720 RepID=A0A814NYN5_9BILA|nr:unnamed protein product [Adineta steineri]CAF1096713.1 unnamed protein product [Adineta steineri]
MKGVIFFFVLTATFGSVRSQQACMNGNWAQCAAEAVTQFRQLYSSYNTWHDNEQVPMFGTTCYSASKAGFYRWNWRWQGRFWCPTLSGLEGYSNNWESQKGAIEHAVEDYVRKGAQHGFLPPKRLLDPLDGPGHRELSAEPVQKITRFRNAETGYRLDSNGYGEAYVLESNGGDYQVWHIINADDNSVYIRNKKTDLFLDSNWEGKVYTLPANKGAYQRWRFDGLRIINIATGRALDSSYNKKLYTLNPNGGNYQNWIQE